MGNFAVAPVPNRAYVTSFRTVSSHTDPMSALEASGTSCHILVAHRDRCLCCGPHTLSHADKFTRFSNAPKSPVTSASHATQAEGSVFPRACLMRPEDNLESFPRQLARAHAHAPMHGPRETEGRNDFRGPRMLLARACATLPTLSAPPARPAYPSLLFLCCSSASPARACVGQHGVEWIAPRVT